MHHAEEPIFMIRTNLCFTDWVKFHAFFWGTTASFDKESKQGPSSEKTAPACSEIKQIYSCWRETRLGQAAGIRAFSSLGVPKGMKVRDLGLLDSPLLICYCQTRIWTHSDFSVVVGLPLPLLFFNLGTAQILEFQSGFRTRGVNHLKTRKSLASLQVWLWAVLLVNPRPLCDRSTNMDHGEVFLIIHEG